MISQSGDGPGKLQFSLWQGLGNKYIVLHQEELPFELTAERVRLLVRS